MNWHGTAGYASDATAGSECTGAFGRLMCEADSVTFLFPEMDMLYGQCELRPIAERGIADAVDDLLQILASCDCAECAADAVFV